MRIAGSRVATVAALVCVAVALTSCGGGGGGGSNDRLLVTTSQAFPNGKFLPVVPSPGTLNQCIWIELTAKLNPASVFDGSTTNGLSSNVRCLNYFYTPDEAQITPATPLTRTRLNCIAVLDNRTNFDFSTKSYASSPVSAVTAQQMNIDPNIPMSGDRGSYLILVADTDGDPNTIESFLPTDVSSNTNRLQNSQIMVNLTQGLYSTGGRFLEQEYTTNFIVGPSDKIAPELDTVNPQSGATGVDIGTAITLRFNEPVDASTVLLAPINSTVPATGGVNVQVSVQMVPPGQSTPQLINIPGTLTPSSGQSASITFTPLARFPGQTLVLVNVYSAASTLAGAAPPYYPASADSSGNTLAPNQLSDSQFTFTTGDGPKLANNPIDPECIHFITSSSGMGTVRVNPLDRAATGVEDMIQEVDSSGGLTQAFPGGLNDGVVGPWIARLLGVPGSGNNRINDPPRQCQYWLAGFAQRGNPPTTNVVDPGKYTPPAIADDILCTGTALLPSEPPPAAPGGQVPNWCPESITPGFQNVKPAAPYGVYLFVTNEAENVVHCISSHTFQVVKDINTPDPRGVAISPDMAFLYVSNFGANNLSVLDVTAGIDGLPRGDLIRLVPVGNGPLGVAAQPNGEDILICNRLSKTVSVIAVTDLGNPGSPVRVDVQAGDPFEVAAGARLTNLLLPYYAFITNPGTSEVVIFESGPPQTNGFGRDQVVEVVGQLPIPMGISTDQWFNTSTYQNPVPFNDSMTGAYVVLNGDASVVHLKATRFSIPFFPNPPPALVEARFEVGTTFRVGTSPNSVCVDNNVLWCGTPEGKQWPFVDTRPNPPVTAVPARIYVSNGDGSIGVYEIRTGREIVTLKADGARRLFGYYKQ